MGRPAGGRAMTTELIDGPITRYVAAQAGVSLIGCPMRETRECRTCIYGEQIAALCDYHCTKCRYRSRCPCGWEDESKRAAVYEEAVCLANGWSGSKGGILQLERLPLTLEG